MHLAIVIIIYLAVLVSTGDGYRNPFYRPYSNDKQIRTTSENDDPGEPLFLTPYLEQGKIEEARRLSSVEMPPYMHPSYSGYLTVNKEYHSNIFFWFFPAQNGSKPDTPLILWLNGGPGTSSLFGLFNQVGPISIDVNGTLHSRSITWNTNYHLLVIDNPVGTGFSFTTDDQGFARNEDDVARDFYSCLTQFFQIYTEYAANPFYTAGESYAGKYLPAIVYKIHTENQNTSVKTRINLKGMSIGDGVCDPINQYDYGAYLYQIGLIDENEKNYVDQQVVIMKQLVQQEKYIEAFLLFDALINGATTNTTYFYNVTGIKDYYNYVHTLEPEELNYYIPFITQANRRKQIHVGNISYGDQDDIVADKLLSDVMQSMADKIATILDANYGVLIYNGQLDAIIPSPLTLNWVDKLVWSGADELRRANRTVWKVEDSDEEIAGYIKTANKNNFFLAVVRNAGHMGPYDQPRALLNLIDRFIAAQHS